MDMWIFPCICISWTFLDIVVFMILLIISIALLVVIMDFGCLFAFVFFVYAFCFLIGCLVHFLCFSWLLLRRSLCYLFVFVCVISGVTDVIIWVCFPFLFGSPLRFCLCM